ncbi:MAG: hypothetical protein AAGU75_01005 [Bacillota bacterium]
MKRKIIRIIVIFLLVILTAAILVAKYVPSVVDPDYYGNGFVLYKFLPGDNHIEIYGDFQFDFTDSFHGYEYEYDGKNLYLKLYAHLYGLRCRDREYTTFKISIDGNFEDLESIYLVDNEKKRKVWSR